MGIDIFGKPISKKTSSIMIFHDERRHKKDWLYHGFIVIPQEIFPEVMERLNDFRTSTSYHKKIHFSEMTEEKYSRQRPG